jgi:hypothetical protein
MRDRIAQVRRQRVGVRQERRKPALGLAHDGLVAEIAERADQSRAQQRPVARLRLCAPADALEHRLSSPA